jgi:hypothetical protein
MYTPDNQVLIPSGAKLFSYYHIQTGQHRISEGESGVQLLAFLLLEYLSHYSILDRHALE